ncbi:hypothetical protein ARMSODRAFT_966120 [Armillaria solidipes]|uniref:Uncharacterized protein n=1 Tax=Armillaria solidipes TaxID=1076256 RepID=A0A2H3B993_9AGAR|nr:hypothetical protein ARMSODRAFT_966120 [Armillaria solidipes]
MGSRSRSHTTHNSAPQRGRHDPHRDRPRSPAGHSSPQWRQASRSRSQAHDPHGPSPRCQRSKLYSPQDKQSESGKHARSPEGSSNEEEQQRNKKTKKSRGAKDPIEAKGCIIGCYCDSWRMMGLILEEGVARLSQPDGPDDAEADKYTKEQNICFNIFQDMIQVWPNLCDVIADVQDVDIVAEQIDAGRHHARAEDTNTIKSGIHKYHPWKPAFLAHRSQAGFIHEECGWLLCPPKLDWDNPEIRNAIQTGKIHINETDLPHLLYANHTIDKKQPFAGLLKSSLLLAAYRAVFTGPSSVLHEDGPRNTRPGNATKHKITKVSVASIVYIACQVRFIITSQPTFTGGGGKGEFNYCKFYRNIVMAVNEFMDNNERLELLAWWNEKIFSGVEEEGNSETG